MQSNAREREHKNDSARTNVAVSGGARSRYEIFFTSWKDADPEIPVLKQAKAEYAKLE